MGALTLPCFVKGYALQSYLCAEDGLSYASKNLFHYWYIDGSLRSEMPDMWNHNRIDQLRNNIEATGVSPLFHGNFKVPLASDIHDIRMAAIEYTKKEIDLSSQLKSPLIIHGGAIVEPRLVIRAKKAALECYLDSLKILLDYADESDVEIYLENLSNYKNSRPFHYIFTHEEEFEYILSKIDAKLFLDIGHANIGNDSPLEIFKKFHKYIAGMSFSNNDGIYDQHLSLFNGIVDYKALIHEIISTKWNGIVAFEIRDQSPSANIQELEKIHESVRHC